MKSDIRDRGLDTNGLSSVIGVVVSLGVVLIGLYVLATVVSSMDSTAVEMSNLTWTNSDTPAFETFGVSSMLPIAIVGVGIMTVFVGAFAVIGDGDSKPRERSTDNSRKTENYINTNNKKNVSDSNFNTYGDGTKIEFSSERFMR